MKILLVDDDAMLLLRLSKQLKQAGHQVETVKDGKAALKKILECPPQLVITDWHMQPLDGLTLCRTLRDSPLGESIYVIMLTASETEDELVRAFDAGIDDYVTKPVSLRVLLARIKSAQRIVSLQEALTREHAALEHRARELELLNRKLEQLAHTDFLTGLPNRRYAIERLNQELAESRRGGRPLSVMILDLDHFKRINDTLGHEAGDRVLVHSARILRETLRSCDVACRFGGEEFLVIAPDTDSHDGKRLAERLCHAIAANQPELPLPAPLTVSIGLATASPGEDVKTLIHRADVALYHSKEQGRNRVTAAA
ncbi:diguanylate cyclase [Methylomarinovum caldicuralii]|uniref:diguanylate cyclase n=1 Tax=Methylomarinovum caldicuralii TaxID=438856 RepID=UPI002954738C|nr:diguanylate cyclase [Methylomarinovum caldicuralii]